VARTPKSSQLLIDRFFLPTYAFGLPLYSYDNLLIESKEKYRQTNKVSVKRIKGFFYNAGGYKNVMCHLLDISSILWP
ncbi:MAG: hypothetical protein ACRCYN_08355, partial [Plesiomonas sp.]